MRTCLAARGCRDADSGGLFVRLLAAHGAKLDAGDAQGRTPLHRALGGAGQVCVAVARRACVPAGFECVAHTLVPLFV